MYATKQQRASSHSTSFLNRRVTRKKFFDVIAHPHGHRDGPAGQLIQKKAVVGNAEDQFEQEADSMADRVVQRQSVAEDEKTIQQKTNSINGAANSSRPSAAVSGQLRSSSGGGQKLPEKTRSSMESSFGYDFGNVRVHTDTRAMQMNETLGARAFTYGSDVFFDKGEYSPGTGQGKHLLAHELAHVVQQESGTAGKTIRMKKRKFTPGRPAHNHKPGKWAAVQADAKKNCNPLTEEGRILCACAALGPENVIKTAMFAQFRGKPIATKHLEHYLTGGGKEFDENANLKKLINVDPTVRDKLADEIAKSNTGHVFIEQGDYTDQDFRFAFGGIDRVEWEVDKAAGTVDIWFIDRYDFHPVGFGYIKHKGPGDIPRITNCVHAAAVEMKSVGSAKDFWMKGEATFPLSKFAKSPGGGKGGGGDDL